MLRALAPLLAIPLLTTLFASGCASPRGTVFATDPPGARVLVDGTDSGFATPCKFLLPGADLQRIEFELPGYETATRFVADGTTSHWILWREMSVGPQTYRSPIWINWYDLWHPRIVVATTKPSRLFVRLRREADR